jgi:hypothetical protein
MAPEIYTRPDKSSTMCEHCPFAAAIRDATPALNRIAEEMTRAQVVRTARKLASDEQWPRRTPRSWHFWPGWLTRRSEQSRRRAAEARG